MFLFFCALLAFLGVACSVWQPAQIEQAEPPPAVEEAEEAAEERELSDWLELPDGVEPVEFETQALSLEYGGETAEWTVLIADTGARRQRGLMHWTGLPERHGMLFIFENPPVHASFWNNNVPIDLSVAYLDEDGRVMEIVFLDARDQTLKGPEEPYWYAFEVPRGRFAEEGIGIGDRIAVEELAHG